VLVQFVGILEPLAAHSALELLVARLDQRREMAHHVILQITGKRKQHFQHIFRVQLPLPPLLFQFKRLGTNVTHKRRQIHVDFLVDPHLIDGDLLLTIRTRLPGSRFDLDPVQFHVLLERGQRTGRTTDWAHLLAVGPLVLPQQCSARETRRATEQAREWGVWRDRWR
jgi:hypothetical protein